MVSCKKESVCEGSENLITNNRPATAPFRGVFTATSEMISPAPAYQEALSGNGHASTLGRSIYIAVMDIDMSGTPPYPVTGGATFQTKSGGEFNTQFTGTSTPNGNGTSTVVLQHIVTDGIGKFINATGTLTSTSISDPANPATLITFSGGFGF